MKQTHNDAPVAMEYAALLLEQIDAGGTLPAELRKWAGVYENLLAACEAVLAEQEYGQPDRIISPETETELRAAIARAKGESDGR